MKSLIVFLMLLAIPAMGHAEVKTIKAEAEAQMGEVLSKHQATRICLAWAKRRVLEEIGVWIITETTVTDMRLTKDRIKEYAAAFVPIKTQYVRMDGLTVECAVSAKVDQEAMLREMKSPHGRKGGHSQNVQPTKRCRLRELIEQHPELKRFDPWDIAEVVYRREKPNMQFRDFVWEFGVYGCPED